jgi:hypothetical protein
MYDSDELYRKDCFSEYIELLNIIPLKCQVTDIVHDIEDLFDIFTNSNAQTNKFMESAYFRPISTDVKTVNWNPMKRMICLGSTSPLLSDSAIDTLIEADTHPRDDFFRKLFSYLFFVPASISEYFVNENDWSISEVDIRIYDIHWLNGQAKFFLKEMAESGTPPMY